MDHLMSIPVDMGQQKAQAATAAAGRMNQQTTREEARATAEEFEAVFIAQMMRPMFEGVGNDPLMGGGQGEKMFSSMLVDEYGKIVSRSGGIGIADAVMKSILDLQQVKDENAIQDQEPPQ